MGETPHQARPQLTLPPSSQPLITVQAIASPSPPAGLPSNSQSPGVTPSWVPHLSHTARAPPTDAPAGQRLGEGRHVASSEGGPR